MWCTSSDQVMPKTRMLCISFLHNSIFSLSIISQHLPGCHNQAADALSRDRLPLFHSLVSQAPLSQSPIHLTLVELLVSLCPDWTDNSWTTRFLSILQKVSHFNTKGIQISSEPLPPFLFSQQSSAASPIRNIFKSVRHRAG